MEKCEGATPRKLEKKPTLSCVMALKVIEALQDMLDLLMLVALGSTLT